MQITQHMQQTLLNTKLACCHQLARFALVCMYCFPLSGRHMSKIPSTRHGQEIGTDLDMGGDNIDQP